MIKIKSSAATHVGLRRTANEDRYFADDARGLYVVCDGMGGHRSGELAAHVALESFVSVLSDGTCDMSGALELSNSAVVNIEGAASWHSPGSTLTALRILDDGTAEWAQAGDSDLIRWRGGIVEAIADHHVDGWGCLTNFCGIGDEFRVSTGKTSARPGDRFIVASDGLSKHFDLKRSETLRAFLGEPKMRLDVAECMVALCNERGGKDNITVIIVDVMEG